MKTKSTKVLPKMPNEIANGGVYPQLVRCGKPNCKCAKGKLHSGFYYLFTRVNGKLKKAYVPKSAVKEISSFVEEARLHRAENRSIVALNREALRTMSDLIRDLEIQVIASS